MSKEAMKLALEALNSFPHRHLTPLVSDARTALREALAQPQQEPVPAAIKTVIEAMQVDPEYAWSWHCNIAMAFVDAGGDHYTGNQGAARFMKMLANVEPAHELPSPPAQPQQEPVAWANPNDLQNFDMKVRTNAGTLHTVPLYTSPPAQRKPLTDEDIEALAKAIEARGDTLRQFARAIEAAHNIKEST